jgi:hypothetical protein
MNVVNHGLLLLKEKEISLTSAELLMSGGNKLDPESVSCLLTVKNLNNHLPQCTHKEDRRILN